MKKLFILLLICVCALLCACGEVVPVETTETAAETATETTTVTTTEKIVADTEPRRKIVNPICNIDWVRSVTDSHLYLFENASMEIEYDFPSDWKRVYNSYLSFEDDNFYTDIDAFFLGKENSLGELPLPNIPDEYINLVDTSKSENLLIRIYEAPFYGQKYYIHAYIRCDGYAFGFHMSSKSQNTEVFDIVAKTISVTREPDIKKYTEFVATDYTLRTVNIGNLFYVRDRSGSKLSMEYLPKEWNIEVSLPASWNKLKCGQSTAEFTPEYIVYSRYGFPTEGVSPNGCMYQAFCGYNAYIAKTAEFYDTEGVTEGGNKYWIEKNERSDYHAIDANILVQLSDEYYYHFSLCVDKDNAELIEKVIDSVRLVTEPSVVVESATVLCNLSWVNSYFYRIAAQKVDVSFSVPANFKALNTHTFDSLTENEQFKVFYELYKVDDAIPLSHLPRRAVTAAKLVDTVDTPEMFAEVYMNYNPELNGGYTYKAVGYGLVNSGYAIPFEFYCNDSDFDIVPSLLSAISVTEPQYAALKNAEDVLLDEELETVRISDLFLVSHSTMYESDGIYLPENSYIELDLPASWELLGKDSTMSNAIYSELGVPSTSLSPEKCLYQGFASDCLYTKETASVYGTRGATDDGRMYWIEKLSYDYYHAVEYHIDVQVSEEYIFSFTLCVDKDNTDLVEQVINSITLVCDTSSANTDTLDKAKSLVEHIVTFALTENWFDESYSPTDLDIFRFLVSACMYQNTDMHPYSNILSVSGDNQNFQISYLDAEKMISEVFGEQKLMDSQYFSDIYDTETASYSIPRGIGLWTSAYSIEITNATIEDEYVRIRGILKNSNSYEYEETLFGEIEVTFECLGDNDNSFLRYKSFKKLI